MANSPVMTFFFKCYWYESIYFNKNVHSKLSPGHDDYQQKQQLSSVAVYLAPMSETNPARFDAATHCLAGPSVGECWQEWQTGAAVFTRGPNYWKRLRRIKCSFAVSFDSVDTTS